jgi:hypothetical protein
MAMSHIIEPRNSAVCSARSRRKANHFNGLQFANCIAKLGAHAAGLKEFSFRPCLLISGSPQGLTHDGTQRVQAEAAKRTTRKARQGGGTDRDTALDPKQAVSQHDVVLE